LIAIGTPANGPERRPSSTSLAARSARVASVLLKAPIVVSISATRASACRVSSVAEMSRFRIASRAAMRVSNKSMARARLWVTG
jgi:hypothetical protein